MIRGKPIQGWQIVVDHINDTWKKRKRSEYGYPFVGRDLKDLRHFCLVYHQWGIMALWDCYLAGADDWTVKHGFSLAEFYRQLPRLVDQPWKQRAAMYEPLFPANPPPPVTEFINKTHNFRRKKERA